MILLKYQNRNDSGIYRHSPMGIKFQIRENRRQFYIPLVFELHNIISLVCITQFPFPGELHLAAIEKKVIALVWLCKSSKHLHILKYPDDRVKDKTLKSRTMDLMNGLK